jgi:ureidoacrylate peracid hydrolase
MMKYEIPQAVQQRLVARQGRLHAYEHIDAKRTALLVVDMQNFYVTPGYQAAVAAARLIVAPINRLAHVLRQAGGKVIWIQMSSRNADVEWSAFHFMLSPERSQQRLKDLAPGADGFALVDGLVISREDTMLTKDSYSAFIRASSPLETLLHESEIDTVLVAGTVTNICCESTARDAMMHNFKTVMVADALAALTEEEHRASLDGFLLYFGDVLSVDETIDRFQN